MSTDKCGTITGYGRHRRAGEDACSICLEAKREYAARRHETAPPCCIDGCERPVNGKGLCSMHGDRMRKHGDPLVASPRARKTASQLFWEQVAGAPPGGCWQWLGEVTGFGDGRFRKPGGERVPAHRFAWEEENGPLADGMVLRRYCESGTCVNPAHRYPKPRAQSLEERFWENVARNGRSECWIWSGGVQSHGYGMSSSTDGRRLLAHRVAWELIVGPIPEGMHIDHRCHTPRCVNPNHLRPVTHKQNMENHSGATARSTTGIRGVYRSREKWRASVMHDRELHELGVFPTKEEAEEAVVAARIKLYTHNDRDRVPGLVNY